MKVDKTNKSRLYEFLYGRRSEEYDNMTVEFQQLTMKTSLFGVGFDFDTGMNCSLVPFIYSVQPSRFRLLYIRLGVDST